MKVSRDLGLAALSFVVAFPAVSALAEQTYEADPGHTEVRFGWSHVGVSNQHGEFTTVDATVVLDPDDVEASSVSVTIDASSVSTGVTDLDDHLRSGDFLGVDTYPEITFESTKITQTSENTADVEGNLTIHGVTKPVTLTTTLTHLGAHPLGEFMDYYGGEWIAFSAVTEIDHMEFGVGEFSTGPISIWIDTEMKASN
ncbi:MAG: YceI family protein [Pseudomonadota bacterium]